MRRPLLTLACVLSAGCGLGGGAHELLGVEAVCDGDGVPFRPLTIVESRTRDGDRRGHSGVALLKGLLLVPYGVDGGRGGGGLSIYDLTTPRCPTLVAQVDEPSLREAHGFAFSGDLVVFQSVDGIQFWDLADPRRPRLLRRLPLPGITASDYDLGAWWVTWQAPYLYVAGSGNGLYIVFAPDVASARLVARVDPTRLGNFRVGQTFALGNLLVLAASDQPGLATVDIGDPTRPALLAATRENPPAYSSLLAGERILSAGRDGALHVFDVSDPRRIRFVGSSPVAKGNGKGGYVTAQDGHAFVGFSSQMNKIDLRDLAVAGVGSSRRAGRDEDFATVLGNLVFVGDDHAVGSALLPHQVGPDRVGPAVDAVSPRDGALRQPLTSRVGVSFGDAVEPSSLGAASFIVRPVGGAALRGAYSAQLGIASFAPDGGFAPDTTYEVVIPAGGVKDVSGNGVPRRFVSRFSTGPAIEEPLACGIAPTTPVTPGASAEITVTATGGEPTTTIRQYPTIGHHTVVATVTRGAQTASCARVQTVHAPLTAARPSAASSIVHDGDRDLVWVVNPDHDSVTAIDGAHRRRFEVAVGRQPRTLARAPDGAVWVVNQGSATLTVLDGASGDARATLALPANSRPYGVAFAPDGNAAFVTLQGTGELLRLDPSGAITGRLRLGAPVRGLAITADSRRVFVARFVSTARAGELYEIDARALAPLRTVALLRDPGPDGEEGARGVPNYLGALAVSPDGSHLLVPSKKDNVERGLARDGRPLTFESTVRTIVSRVELGAAVDTLGRRVDLNDRDLAQAVAFSKHGDYFAVAVQGSNGVEIRDAYDGRAVTALPDVGRAPQGVAFSADFRRLYVNNYLSRSVTVYDASGLIDASSTALPRLATVATVADERLAPEVLRGKQIFYDASDPRMSRDGYLSCASCHLDGEGDGQVWDLTAQGEGLRNTVTLVGRGGVRQGRVHWSGNFDEIQDFEHVIRDLLGGRGFMSDAAFAGAAPLGEPKAGRSAELDALAAYVTSLGAVNPSPYRGDRRGAALFARLGCAGCHGGRELTDGGLHDVGTLAATSGKRLGGPLLGIDTPTLKGVWETPPYLHDGSAATLREVLTTANPTGRHGATAGLSAAEIDQLVAYLLSLD